MLSSTYIPVVDLAPRDNPADFNVYRWNEKVLNNHFCKHCGIFTYIGDGENNQEGYRVNLGCVEGLDPLALEISAIDGKSLPWLRNFWEAGAAPFLP